MASKKKKTAKRAAEKEPVTKPVKKKPPKKKRPPSTPAPKSPGVSEEMTREELRRCAGQDYVYSPQHLSIVRLSEHPFYAGRVPVRTLEYWAVQDRWAERRKKWFEEIQKRAESELGNRLTQARIAELEAVDRLIQAIDAEMFKVVKGALKFKKAPKSMESLIDKRIKAAQWRDQLCAAVGNQLPTQIATSISEPASTSRLHPAVKPIMTEEEIFQAANTVVRMRMDSQPKGPDDEDERQPSLKVLDGKKEI